MKAKIAFAAPSLIRTKDEGKIVLGTISNLSRLNIPIIITDGGSPKEDKLKINKLPNVTLYEAKNLTDEITFSLKEGAKIAENILYSQSDKLDFSKNVATNLIKTYLELPPKSILIPSRTKESFNSYPKYQQTVENFLNFFMSDYIGIKNDYYLGPKIFPSILVKYLDQITKDIEWGIEAFLYVVAKRLNLNFKFFDVFVKPPKDIGTKEEIKLNRLKSITRQLEGFYQGLNAKI